MKNREKEYADHYKIVQSVTVGSKRFVLGQDDGCKQPFLVANHRVRMDGLFAEYYDVGISDDYMEILAAFIQRQKDECVVLMQQRRIRGSDGVLFRAADCLPNVEQQDLNGQIVVLNAKTLSPEFRIKEEQLFYVTGGFGAAAHARGTKVYGRDCCSGEGCYVQRSNILGILKPENIPLWAARNVEKFQAEIEAKLESAAEQKKKANRERTER